ncbi:MAG: type II toxin-antitoxin system RelE/ParE family toxin [Bacteroidetes bacterium]|nr:type II toxin-antitoxin system RelE/ParE family toxin [Bacteroidota bacterium]
MKLKETKVIWSPLAEETYLNTLEFILKKWTIKEADELVCMIKDLIEKIQSFKNLCPPSRKHKNIRKCVVSYQTSLVYRIHKNFIEIVAFIDNRSNTIC